ncbi:hypothetical protein NP534_08185 [Pseudomonas sp. 39004]|uniref:hypothetical protein n=1 Tax=Pseudomonas sp. 39004 TaxID=2967213 RepID=UPI00236488DE|nr:hypothetical protein [Pseudomonas sp. 39004]MDD1960083.1 hypothetical protein [Pseudomonas sp. 39004]
MSAKEFAKQLKVEIENFAAQGQDSVSIETLTSGLDKFINSASEESESILIERLKAYLQSEVEKEKYNHSADLEMFKSVIQTGQNALRAIVLLNGGAAVALLAFIGKLADVSRLNIPLFAAPLTIFVVGAFLSTISSGLTYLTQLLYSEEGKWRTRAGVSLQIASVLLGLTSLCLFGYGTYRAYEAFIALGT